MLFNFNFYFLSNVLTPVALDTIDTKEYCSNSFTDEQMARVRTAITRNFDIHYDLGKAIIYLFILTVND